MKIKKISVVKWSILFLVFLLSATTLVLLKSVDRFYVKNEQMLSDPLFLQGDKHWKQAGNQQVTYSNKQVSLSNLAGASDWLSQNVPVDTPAYINFSFEGGTNDIIPGEKKWQRASGTIIYRDKAGERVGSVSVALIAGTTPMRTFSHRELLRKQLGSVDIQFRLLSASGTFHFSNPVLSLLDEFPFYKNMKITISVFWLLALAGLAIVAVRVLSWFQLGGLLLVGAGILVGALMPEELMTRLSSRIADGTPESILSEGHDVLFNIVGIKTLAGPGAVISKLGHFLAFCFIGFVVGWAHRRIGLFFGAASLATFAFLTETLQLLVSGRTPSVADLLIDCSGGLLGMVIGICCLFFYTTVFKPAVPDEPLSGR